MLQLAVVSVQKKKKGVTEAAGGGTGVDGDSTKRDGKAACPQSSQQPPVDPHPS